jgi:hypothetical protein
MLGEIGLTDGGQSDPHVEPIEQRPGQACAIALDLRHRALTAT